MIYSSSDATEEADRQSSLDDSNTYQPFRAMNATVIKRIDEELAAQEYGETEGTSRPWEVLILTELRLGSSHWTCWRPYQGIVPYVTKHAFHWPS